MWELISRDPCCILKISFITVSIGLETTDYQNKSHRSAENKKETEGAAVTILKIKEFGKVKDVAQGGKKCRSTAGLADLI